MVSEVLPITPQPLGLKQNVSPFQLQYSMTVQDILWQEEQLGDFLESPEINTN